jgi:hypothetical protein
LCSVHLLFIHLGGGFEISSIFFSTIQVVGFSFHPSRWWVLCFIYLIFIHQVVGSMFHPSSFHPSRWFSCVFLALYPSVFHPPRWWILRYIHLDGGVCAFHPSKWWVIHFIQVLFIHLGGSVVFFCITSRCFSSIWVVGFALHEDVFHPFGWWVLCCI